MMRYRFDYPLVFEPILRPQVWGGRRLQSLLHKSLPESGRYGESWEISPLPGALSRVVDGPAAGDTIDALWAHGLADCAGCSIDSGFPWLIKWLDIADRLSVQVHPNDEQARRMLGQPCGKTEAWVVLHAEPAARVYAGFRPGVTAADMQHAVSCGALVDCLHEFAPQAGDCIHLPAGTVHAAEGGLVLAEVQQPSDATFRLFDWNRVGTDGKPRALHIAQALDCLIWPQGPVQPVLATDCGEEIDVQQLLATPQFELSRWGISNPRQVRLDRLGVWMVLNGAVVLQWASGSRTFVRGDTVLLPPALETVEWQAAASGGTATLLRVDPGRTGSWETGKRLR